jgi:predicted SprT family Zn-dependent metalloprotease
MNIVDGDPRVETLAAIYIDRLELPADGIWLTCRRQVFQRWLGRRVSSRLGGAYVYLPHAQAHAVLNNIDRIATGQPKALEVVVCEELLHMRHWLDGDRRRHAKHGCDRIAVQVAGLTGATPEEVRGCLLPVAPRPYRYRYRCPTCGRSVMRRKRGLWSCGHCSPRFSLEHVLVLESALQPEPSGSRETAP